MKATQRTLADLNWTIIEALNMKAGLSVIINRNEQLNPEECINGLQKGPTIEFPYSEDVIRGPTTLFHVLRDYLVLKSFQYKQHLNTDKLLFGIAHCF